MHVRKRLILAHTVRVILIYGSCLYQLNPEKPVPYVLNFMPFLLCLVPWILKNLTMLLFIQVGN